MKRLVTPASQHAKESLRTQGDSMIRKKPRQRRSHDTVQAIITAAKKLSSETNLEQSNTRRIAERAGVSIGSLYQYFQNKDGILDAIIDDIVEGRFHQLKEEVKAIDEIRCESFVIAYTKQFMSFFGGDRNIRNQLMKRNPEKLLKKVLPLEEELHRIVAEKLQHLQDLKSQPDHKALAFILCQTVSSIFRRNVLSESPIDESILFQEMIPCLTFLLQSEARITQETNTSLNQ